MMETLDVAGTWWMPERPDHRVPGILRFDFSGAGILTLIGGLRRPEDMAVPETLPNGETLITVSQDMIEAAGNYSRLHGQSEEKAYTLDGCFQIHSRGGAFGPANEEAIYVNHVYEGIWFSVDEQVIGHKLNFTVDGLKEWSGRSGMNLAIHDTPEVGMPWAELRIAMVPDLKATLPHDGEATLFQQRGFSIGNSMSVSEGFGFQLHYQNPVPIADLLDVASDLQDLISIATDRTAQFGPVHVSHPDLAGRAGVKPYFTVWSAWTALRKARDTALDVSDLFFTLEDLGGIGGVAEWMKVAEKYRSPLGRVMATKYAERMYVSDRFLNRAAALEGFDRIDTGRARGRTFANRIARCIDLAGSQFTALVHDTEKWAVELKHHRNELAHHYGRRMRQATDESYYLGDGAFWLFVFCLLREASVSDAVLDQIMTHPKLQLLAKKNRLMFS